MVVCCHAVVAVAAVVVVVAAADAVPDPTNVDDRSQVQLNTVTGLEESPSAFLCRGVPDILEPIGKHKDRGLT